MHEHHRAGDPDCPLAPRVDALEERTSRHEEIIGEEPSAFPPRPGSGLIGAVHSLVTAMATREAAESGRAASDAAIKAEALARRTRMVEIAKVGIPILLTVGGSLFAFAKWAWPHIWH